MSPAIRSYFEDDSALICMVSWHRGSSRIPPFGIHWFLDHWGIDDFSRADNLVISPPFFRSLASA